MTMKRMIKMMSLLVFLCFLVSLVVTVQPVLAKDKIVIGASRPLSGPLAFFEANAFGPLYKMWVEEVNARGGIYVKEYGKKLPVEMLVYDDKSDMGTMTRLLDKLIVQDKVDFVFPPASTAFLFAAGAVTNRHNYILIGAEGGATTIKDMLPGMPYFFMVLEFSDHYQMPALADVLAAAGVKTAAMLWIEDLHGIEYSGVATRELDRVGIKVVMSKSAPPDIKDVSSILKEAQKLNADAFLSFTYPDTCFLVTGTAQAIGFNPKAFLLGPGGNFEVYRTIFGDDVIEGVLGEGAWNEKSSKAHAEFVKKYLKNHDRSTLDWWGHDVYWCALQSLEEAIKIAGTLDQKKVRDVLATQKFKTILGTTWFENQMLAEPCYAGQIGQWQKGIFEVVGPKKKATAKFIYPKPAFPAPKPKPEGEAK
jgi:branched-chain amino acid transport system substrate-binding protein